MRFTCRSALASRMLPILTFAALASVASAQSTRLELGKTIQGDLSGGQSQDYSITLEANQYLYAVVTQPVAAVLITFYAPDGRKVLEVDTRQLSRPARIVWVADVAGEY